jgi:hypothetical protein
MRKLALLLLLIPTALSAQSIQTISPQQCVWRAGDNPAWAAPNLDDSGWQSYAQWRLTSGHLRIAGADLAITAVGGRKPAPAVRSAAVVMQ